MAQQTPQMFQENRFEAKYFLKRKANRGILYKQRRTRMTNRNEDNIYICTVDISFPNHRLYKKGDKSIRSETRNDFSPEPRMKILSFERFTAPLLNPSRGRGIYTKCSTEAIDTFPFCFCGET